MVCVELYLACRKTCRPSVSQSASLLESGMLRHGKKKKSRSKCENMRRTGAINDKVVVIVFTDFLLEPVHILQEVSALPQKTLGLNRSGRTKGALTYSKQ